MDAEIIDTLEVCFDDLDELQVELGMTDRLPEQTKSVTLTKNGNYSVTPDKDKVLTQVDVEVQVLPIVTGMTSISFYDNPYLTEVPYKLGTANLTTMAQMFSGCISLKNPNAEDYDTSNVTNMYRMFSSCTSLQTLDASGWDVSKVTRTQEMFSSCTSLQTLDVSGWDVSKVTNMYQMFYSCSSLQTVIGSHTLEEVEAGEVTALNNAGTGTYIDLRNVPTLHYSSFLAVIKGAYDRKAAGLSNQTYYLSKAAYNACYNDDGTTPDATTIAERKAEFTALLTAKGYNLAQS